MITYAGNRITLRSSVMTLEPSPINRACSTDMAHRSVHTGQRGAASAGRVEAARLEQEEARVVVIASGLVGRDAMQGAARCARWSFSSPSLLMEGELCRKRPTLPSRLCASLGRKGEG